jgi:hypothetical protein
MTNSSIPLLVRKDKVVRKMLVAEIITAILAAKLLTALQMTTGTRTRIMTRGVMMIRAKKLVQSRE